MDVSIIIVNYNTSKLLTDCINSIKEKTYGINYEIIVVDNSSIDDSVSILKLYYQDVKVIESKENLGFGKANNLGAKSANGKYLLLLNTDTLLINNAIKIFYDFMEEESSKDIGACGGNLYKSDFQPNFSYSSHFPSLFNIFCYRAHLQFLIKNESFNNSGNIKNVAIIIGADLFIRKKVFYELNGFDPRFFMYVEDGDLSYVMKKNNYRVVSNPNAKIIHLQGKSSNTIFKYKMEFESYLIYFRKHSNITIVKAYKLIELFFAFSKYTFSLITFNKLRKLDYLNMIKFILSK